jgi:hypothetical protein
MFIPCREILKEAHDRALILLNTALPSLFAEPQTAA